VIQALGHWTTRVFWYTYISFICLFEFYTKPTHRPDLLWCFIITVWMCIAFFDHMQWAFYELISYKKKLDRFLRSRNKTHTTIRPVPGDEMRDFWSWGLVYKWEFTVQVKSGHNNKGRVISHFSNIGGGTGGDRSGGFQVYSLIHQCCASGPVYLLPLAEHPVNCPRTPLSHNNEPNYLCLLTSWTKRP